MNKYLLIITAFLSLQSCVEYQTHRYNELQDGRIGYKDNAFYIAHAKKSAEENYPNINLKKLGQPSVSRRVGWRRFYEDDTISVDWVHTVDDENLRASRNPITTERLEIGMTRSGSLVSHSYGHFKGHALFAQPGIDDILKAQQVAAPPMRVDQ